MVNSVIRNSTPPLIYYALKDKGYDPELAGFAAVDLQLNGITFRENASDLQLKTVDFSNPNLIKDDIRKAALAVYQTGTSYFLATIVTSSPEVMERNGRMIAEVMNEQIGKGILGIHFEGPCIDVDCKGAHREEIIAANPPSIELMSRIYEACRSKKDGPSALAMITMSPNYDASPEVIQWLADRKVVVSLGHFRAHSWANIDRALEAGATGLTHVGNAWSKDSNDYGAKRLEHYWMLNDPRTVPMIIADMIHCPAEFVGQTLRATQTQVNVRYDYKRPIIVSDLSPLAGALTGTIVQDIFHGLVHPAEVTMIDGQLRTKDLTGSCHSLGEQAMLLLAAGFSFLSREQILATVKRNPIELLFHNLTSRGWIPDPRHLIRCKELNVMDWQDIIASGDPDEGLDQVVLRHNRMGRAGIELLPMDDWLKAAQ